LRSYIFSFYDRLPLAIMLANMCHFFLSKVAVWLPKQLFWKLEEVFLAKWLGK